MTSLPVFHYRGSDLPADQAFEQWRELMAPLFLIERAANAPSLPRGSSSTYMLDGMMCNRTVFNSQHIVREPKRIDATPDHLVLQYYRTGGFDGVLGDHPVTVRPGHVAICDLSRPLDVRALRSDTIGLTIPRHRLAGLSLARQMPRLDRRRERLLGARMDAFYRHMPRLGADAAAGACDGVIACLFRLLDPSGAADVLDGSELHLALVALADRTIRERIGASDLTPTRLAERIGTSRATLYRAFAPLGGVSRYTQDLRLDAVREALANPLERRGIAQIAGSCGLADPAHFSRIFKTRFGMSPRDMRRQAMERGSRTVTGDGDPPAVRRWWFGLSIAGHAI